MMDDKAGTAAKMDELETFVSHVLKEKGVADLPEEVQEQMKADLYSRVEDRINAAVLEALPPEKLGEFEKLLEAGDMDKMRAFSQESIPNLAEIIAGELIKFKSSYLSA